MRLQLVVAWMLILGELALGSLSSVQRSTGPEPFSHNSYQAPWKRLVVPLGGRKARAWYVFFPLLNLKKWGKLCSFA
jgi:hypothetical protein